MQFRTGRVTIITTSYFASAMDRESSEVSCDSDCNHNSDCPHVSSLSFSGPPEGWQGGPPSRGCEVYVTRIPRDCFEQELLPVFSRAGEIYEMRLMMDHNGLNRGYAYVKFTNTQVRY